MKQLKQLNENKNKILSELSYLKESGKNYRKVLENKNSIGQKVQQYLDSGMNLIPAANGELVPLEQLIQPLADEKIASYEKSTGRIYLLTPAEYSTAIKNKKPSQLSQMQTESQSDEIELTEEDIIEEIEAVEEVADEDILEVYSQQQLEFAAAETVEKS